MAAASLGGATKNALDIARDSAAATRLSLLRSKALCGGGDCSYGATVVEVIGQSASIWEEVKRTVRRNAADVIALDADSACLIDDATREQAFGELKTLCSRLEEVRGQAAALLVELSAEAEAHASAEEERAAAATATAAAAPAPAAAGSRTLAARTRSAEER